MLKIFSVLFLISLPIENVISESGIHEAEETHLSNQFDVDLTGDNDDTNRTISKRASFTVNLGNRNAKTIMDNILQKAQQRLNGLYLDDTPIGPLRERVFRRIVHLDGGIIDLPVQFKAHITRYNPNRRLTYPQGLDAYLDRMGFRQGDQRGHIVAHSLDGPNILQNFFPHSSVVNNGRMWKASETEIRDFLKDHPQGYAKWAVQFFYHPRMYPTSVVGTIRTNDMYRPIGYCLIYSTYNVVNGNAIMIGKDRHNNYVRSDLPEYHCGNNSDLGDDVDGLFTDAYFSN
ncbi:uncharacterized protein LOC129575833 [Sitodiplosis mosellana]|uniref:uncharacterized protein LOC129575833 n=1 Tax=Sitodiplosis mosellana TaxID=263140 RepID=UPI002444C0D1|nr:uncharacterized protein LOC129575833 [Sitodiplosis mosellana]